MAATGVIERSETARFLGLDITLMSFRISALWAFTGSLGKGKVRIGNLRRWGITDGWPTATRAIINFVLLLSVPPAGGTLYPALPQQAPPPRTTKPPGNRGFFLFRGLGRPSPRTPNPLRANGASPAVGPQAVAPTLGRKTLLPPPGPWTGVKPRGDRGLWR